MEEKYSEHSPEELRKILAERDERIEKLEAIIYVMQDERDRMTEDFRATMSTLVEKLKSEAEQRTGVRPQTAQLLSNSSRTLESSTMSKMSSPSEVQAEKITKKAPCHNCGQNFPETKLKKHMVSCYRLACFTEVCSQVQRLWRVHASNRD